jgi:hypothetical protein
MRILGVALDLYLNYTLLAYLIVSTMIYLEHGDFVLVVGAQVFPASVHTRGNMGILS